jgi:hypothetical protein
MFLVLLVTVVSCRRAPAPAPPAAAVPAAAGEPAPAVTATPAPARPSFIITALPSGAKHNENDNAKDKESTPAKMAAEPGDDRGTPASASRRDEPARGRPRALRVATEQQQPKSKHRERPGHAAPTAETAAGKVVAAREEVAAPKPAVEAPAHTTLRFKNDAGSDYKLVEARFVIDGAQLPTVITSAQRGQIQPVFSGELPAGRHVLASRITYQGADHAIFSYMKGYTFHVTSDDEFVAGSHDAVSMTVICKEKTGFNQPMERRLFVTVE